MTGLELSYDESGILQTIRKKLGSRDCTARSSPTLSSSTRRMLSVHPCPSSVEPTLSVPNQWTDHICIPMVSGRQVTILMLITPANTIPFDTNQDT